MTLLRFLPGPVKGLFSILFICLNTLVLCLPLYCFALLRLLLPEATRPWCTRRAMNIAELWISINNLVLDLFQALDIQVELPEGLGPDRWYLVVSNHQSWSDILILQRIFNRRIPMLKFFIKQELIYIPVIGIAWWVLDFPIMKRYSREYLQKHPERRGQDLQTTRRSCERFELTPVSILNFLEGTRFTQAKHDHQKSPYNNLLKPRTGGVAIVVGSLFDQLEGIVDVTIQYDGKVPGFLEFLKGYKPAITINVELIPLPAEFRTINDETAQRVAFQAWIKELWHQKDLRLSAARSTSVETYLTP